MRTKAIISGAEQDALEALATSIRLARLRRNITQAEFAERMGVARLSVVSLEKGRPGVTVGTLLKAMTVLGYTDRIGALLAADPIGDGMAMVSGRQRATGRADVADF
ncbi:helix-turn-helix transcriptional regulator [Methylobacterium sp. W2]|uniref:helix-turn-helix transcriptional regulator n=1 Tax=Methylobacterium sp. W2 TaxID=2598107 RepID=UPI001D0CA865|nr:helix-turn-helix transcriptional regulator [Methylobacterium sp. W2]MCC0807466.1 helix-turn-helix transcriptional regulator [Methylobacterium sp. W2]